MTARDIGKTAPRGREAPLLDLALVSNSGISLPYPRYIRKATALACPSQVRATSPVKRPRLWGSGVRAPVALICQYIDRHKERFAAWPICRVLSDSGTKIAPATALHHTTGHYLSGPQKGPATAKRHAADHHTHMPQSVQRQHHPNSTSLRKIGANRYAPDRQYRQSHRPTLHHHHLTEKAPHQILTADETYDGSCTASNC